MQQKTNQQFKIQANPEQIGKVSAYYKGYIVDDESPYIIERIKLAHCSITIYKTGVILFQGEAASSEYNLWAEEFGLEKVEAISKVDYSNLSCIGSDEVGTGDYFGPIVVCSAFVSKDNIAALKNLGVKDSKLLTDSQIQSMAIEITKLIPYAIFFLDPAKINALSKDKDNLNFLKAYLHNKAILSILEKIPNVKYDAILIDEFTPKENYLKYLEKEPKVESNIITITHGEEAHLAIAAASILARYLFLKKLGELKNTYAISFVKGASLEVDRCAIRFVNSYGLAELKNVAKIKYANTQRVLEYFKNNPLPHGKNNEL